MIKFFKLNKLKLFLLNSLNIFIKLFKIFIIK